MANSSLEQESYGWVQEDVSASNEFSMSLRMSGSERGGITR